MRFRLVVGVAVAMMASPVWAEAVQAIFALPPDYADDVVTWSATPQDLAPDADVLDAMVFEPEAFDGPWQVKLEPGTYLVSAFSEADLFELTATVVPGVAGQRFEVPVLQFETAIPYRCAETAGCSFADAATGLTFSLPQGWAAERPYHADLGDGTLAPEVSGVFFEDSQDEGSAVWFLNPVDWIVEDNTPCREVTVGNLCTFDISPAAETGFGVLAGSLALGSAAP